MLIGIAAVALVALSLRVAPGQGPDPVISPAPGTGRPYTDDSAWNTPIPAEAETDPRSSELIASIRVGPTDGAVTSDATQYSYPVYEVDGQTPRQDIPCEVYSCTVVSESGTTRVRSLEDVPMPELARPSAGSDGSMIIIDTDTGTEYDLWRVRRRPDGTTTIANGSTYNIRWDGMPVEYGSRGAGVPYLAGLVRRWEIEENRLEHAIAFAYPNVLRERCVWPASKTDGKSALPNALPEGARLQLDPTLTDDDFEAIGLSRAGRILARALQRYGMILIDVSGRPKIMVEDVIANPYLTATLESPDAEVGETEIAAIPVEAFRVLALPAGWESGTSAERHGACAR